MHFGGRRADVECAAEGRHLLASWALRVVMRTCARATRREGEAEPTDSNRSDRSSLGGYTYAGAAMTLAEAAEVSTTASGGGGASSSRSPASSSAINRSTAQPHLLRAVLLHQLLLLLLLPLLPPPLLLRLLQQQARSRLPAVQWGHRLRRRGRVTPRCGFLCRAHRRSRSRRLPRTHRATPRGAARLFRAHLRRQRCAQEAARRRA